MKVNYVPRNRTSFMPDQSMGLPANAAPVLQNLDPIRARQDFAAQALTEGSSTAPARGGIGEGLARMAQAVFGGMMRHKADEDLKTAKVGNLGAMKDAFEGGDYMSLLNADDPVAQKLGLAALEQKLKPKKTGHYVKRPDGTEVWESDTGEAAPQVISRPARPMAPLVSEGMISNDQGKSWTEIPNFIDRAGKLAAAKRAPKTVKPDDSGLPPWERKW